MIGERLIGAVKAGEQLPMDVPVGSRYIALRVEAQDGAPVEVLTTSGRTVASTECGPVIDGDFPGSGYTLMLSHDGSACVLNVRVGADATVYGTY